MADSTKILVVADTSCEVKETWGNIDVWMAYKKLAIAVGTAIALHTSPGLAQTTPASESTSASATADKGGWQIVTIDWIQYTFAKIAWMDSSERKRLQIKLDWIDPETGEDLKSFLKQAANQRIEWKQSQLIGKYEQYISNIEKGAKGERSMVQMIATADITPEALKVRAKALLESRNIQLASL